MKVLHISSTTKGGGVAEVLKGLSKYPDMVWVSPYEEVVIEDELLSRFYKVTKKIHNMLQGKKDFLSQDEIGIYEKVNKIILPFVKKLLSEYSVVVIHDPQPISIIPYLKKIFPEKHFIWRCHIDLSEPDQSIWEYVSEKIKDVDIAIFHSEEFVPRRLKPTAVIMPPSIDPDSYKNRLLEDIPPSMKERILNQYRGKIFNKFVNNLKNNNIDTTRLEKTKEQVEKISSSADKISITDIVKKIHNIPKQKSYALQISRYDRFKDPIGVVEAYLRFVKRTNIKKNKIPDLIYAGELVNDDPEGFEIYKQVLHTLHFFDTETKGISEKIKPLILPNKDKEANAVEVNVLQRSASVIIQKSTAEGFGLTVSEGLWKSKPVIGGNVGGIRRQIIHDFNGLLVNSIYEAAEALDRLFSDIKLIRNMGRVAKEIVRRKYLLPIHYQHYKTIFEILLDKKLREWALSKKLIDIQALVSKTKRTYFLRRKENNTEI